jgi:CheY-like chemotaxis protein
LVDNLRVSMMESVFTILMAEDDTLTARIFSRALGKQGHVVEIAADGQVLLDRFFQLRPDFVLVDLMMPRLSGIETIKALRASPEGQYTPIIAATNAFVPKLIEEARVAGADLVCNKCTVTPSELMDRFKSILAVKKSRAA